MKISIITINLNNGDGLKRTIESVVSQTFTDYEYIVIDGESIDGSVDAIKQYADKIAYWVSEPDKGIYNAMNKGILKAKGEYCLFLNSGDSFIGNHVLKEVFNTDCSNTDIIICKLLNQEKGNGLIKPKEEITFYDFFDASLPHPATFIRRDLFVKNGLYTEEYKIVSDWIFFLESIINHQSSWRFVDIVLVSFEKGGISESFFELHLEERRHYLRNHYKGFVSDYYELRSYKKSRMVSFFVDLRNWILRIIKVFKNL